MGVGQGGRVSKVLGLRMLSTRGETITHAVSQMFQMQNTGRMPRLQRVSNPGCKLTSKDLPYTHNQLSLGTDKGLGNGQVEGLFSGELSRRKHIIDTLLICWFYDID